MQNGRTAIIDAADRGYSNIVELMIQRGANIEHQDKVIRADYLYAHHVMVILGMSVVGFHF